MTLSDENMIVWAVPMGCYAFDPAVMMMMMMMMMM